MYLSVDVVLGGRSSGLVFKFLLIDAGKASLWKEYLHVFLLHFFFLNLNSWVSGRLEDCVQAGGGWGHDLEHELNLRDKGKLCASPIIADKFSDLFPESRKK